MSEKFVEALFKSSKSLLSRKRFIVAESSDNEISFEVVEMLIKIAKIIRPGHEINFISGPCQIAHREFVRWEMLVK